MTNKIRRIVVGAVAVVAAAGLAAMPTDAHADTGWSYRTTYVQQADDDARHNSHRR